MFAQMRFHVSFLLFHVSRNAYQQTAFKSVSDLAVALQEFESFLRLTFGVVWSRCTLDLQEAFRSGNILRTMDCAVDTYGLSWNSC